jgi:hypothetical protein
MPQPSIIVVAAATLVLAAACNSETTGPANPNGETMSARIDGEAWSAQSIAIDSAPPSLLVIRGENAARTLALVIPLGQGAGRQTVGSTTPIAAVLVIGPESWAASRTQGGAGSITLTTVVPGHVAGTFEFTMAHEGASPAARAVTSGKFDVRY